MATRIFESEVSTNINRERGVGSGYVVHSQVSKEIDVNRDISPSDVRKCRNNEIKILSWNIAGAKKIKECWIYLSNYECLLFQETCLELNKENNFVGKLDKKFI